MGKKIAKICEVCGRTDLHSHSDEDIQEWGAALTRSISRHPAGRNRPQPK